MTPSLEIKEIMQRFNERLYAGIDDFLIHYDFKYEIDKSLAPAECLSQFMSFYKSLKLDKMLYVIIDEYDHFTNGLLHDDALLFKSILGKDGFVKAFYEVLKKNSGPIIDRTFITGVCSISLDAMTSGYNIATNITNDIGFNAMTALTHDEVRKMINYYNLPNPEEILKDMIDNYDGYIFNENGELVFNTTLVMYYLKNYIRFNEPPVKLLDSNILSNYQQIKNIIKLQNNGYYNEVGSCYGLRNHIGILSDGKLVPCCLDSEGVITLGNIYNDNIEDILKSDRVKEMIKGFQNNYKCEELCRHCQFLESSDNNESIKLD